jgi:hypothetical protein
VVEAAGNAVREWVSQVPTEAIAEGATMILSKFIAGLQTLAPYYDDGDGYHLGAEHDIFYTYPTDRPLSPEDLRKMSDLGWFQENVAPDDAEEWLPEHYDASEGWAAFV